MLEKHPARPSYRSLPIISEGSDYRHAWDYFGAGDNLGTLGLITPEARAGGMAEAVEGVVSNISLPITLPNPPLFGREPIKHTVFSTGRNNLDDRLDSFYPQGSTQWDGFRHVRARELGFFTGIQPGEEFDPEDDRLGVGHWSESGIIGRGVLLDFEQKFRFGSDRADVDNAITAQDLAEACASLTLLPGDILCIRTGWMKHYLGSDQTERERIASERRWPGLSASPDVAEFLWDAGVAAVVADNPSVENAPGSRDAGSLHRRLIPLLGMPLGELFTFEALYAECARRDRWSFAFVSVPLNFPQGAGSPGNAVAIL